LEAAFDVLLPEFGVEKRVHVDQMPIEVLCYTFYSNSLCSRLSFIEPRLR
jgi:protein SSD1